MALLNYTTKVSVHKSVSAIQEHLVARGAKEVSVSYDDGVPTAIHFKALVGQTPETFCLRVNPEAVLEVLIEDRVQRSYQTLEHARKVAWRMLEDMIEGTVAAVRVDNVKLAEIFFGLEVSPSGKAMFELYDEQGLPELPKAV